MKARIATLMAALMALMAVGCNDDETDLGISLVDEGSLYHGIRDTLYADRAWSVLNDSLITTGLSTGLVGNWADPVFGHVSAEVYTQIAPLSNEVNLSAYTIDSAVLCLTLAKPGLLPDSTAPHRFHLRITQLQQPVEDSTTYYSYSTLAADEAMVLLDSVIDLRPYSADDSTTTRLNLRLNPAFNSRLALSATKEEFIQQTKGIRISLVEDADPGFLAINYNATNTVLKVYYNNTSTRFSVGSQAVRFTHFKHNWGGTVFASADSVGGGDLLYIGAMAGTKGKIAFDTAIAAFASAHPRAVIHHAELLLPLAPSAGTDRNNRLLATFYSDSNEYFVFDMSRDAAPFTLYDGHYNAGPDAYRLRIPQHVQYLLRVPTSSKVIELQVADRLESVFGTVVNGADNAASRARIAIVYTE